MLRKERDNWIIGEIEDYEVFAKLFDEDSKYGIYNGPISKLFIKQMSTGDVLCDYDREWLVEPPIEDFIFIENLMGQIINFKNS